MRYKLMQFMYGRNGVDHFSRFLLIFSCVLLLLSYIFVFVKLPLLNSILMLLAIAVLVYCYMRIFSKNLTKRRAENTAYLQYRARVKRFFADQKLRFSQRKEYRFFKCPSCKATLRVPRGKGNLRITCRKCGITFEKKT